MKYMKYVKPEVVVYNIDELKNIEVFACNSNSSYESNCVGNSNPVCPTSSSNTPGCTTNTSCTSSSSCSTSSSSGSCSSEAGTSCLGAGTGCSGSGTGTCTTNSNWLV